MSKRAIDFTKFIDADEVENSLDVFKGVYSLLNALEVSEDGSTSEWDRHAFYALQIAIEHGINEVRELKPNIKYMGDYMREAEQENKQ